MFRRSIPGLTVVAALALTVRPAAAQIGVGYMDVGMTVGMGNVSDASVAFGGRFEKIIQTLPDMEDGLLGIQFGATYYSQANPYFDRKHVPVGVTANYHFRVVESRVDPFLGVGLGYEVIRCRYKGLFTAGCNGSAAYFIGRAGVRYFFSPAMAGYADIGAGGAPLNIGAMFKLR